MGRGSPFDAYRFQSCGDFVCDTFGNPLGLHPSLRDYDGHSSPARRRTTVARERHQESPMGTPYPEDLTTEVAAEVATDVVIEVATEVAASAPTSADWEEE